MRWCSAIIFITWYFPGFCQCFPYFPLFLPHSLHFRRWEWVRKGHHSVFKSFFFQVVAAQFGFWGAQGISNTSKTCFPLGTCAKLYSTWLCTEMIFLVLLFDIFPLSPMFLSFPPKEVSMEIIQLFKVLIVSSFWAAWVVSAAAHFAFWEAQGVSKTPGIISALEKLHEMVFKLALCYLGFPMLSYVSLFCSISRSFPSKGPSMGTIVTEWNLECR